MTHENSTKNQIVINTFHQLFNDSVVLYFKTWSYHWNIEATNFFEIHKLFQEQYSDLEEAIDEIAERIRALGSLTRGNLLSIATDSTLKESSGGENCKEMLEQLINDNIKISNSFKNAAEVFEGEKDHASLDIIARRILSHDKNTWMLKSMNIG